MSAIGFHQTQKFKPSLVTVRAEQSLITQIRLQLQINWCHPFEVIISNLISTYGLTVNIIKTKIEKNAQDHLDLEIQGTILQIGNGLNYLQSLELKIRGKPNTEGDNWYC